ncbi:MAG: serine protease AprX [Thermoplasmata archaeon]|jgi:subtilisin family serine protease|nr:serine protease AprX [Thermoplasmata archaeon]
MRVRAWVAVLMLAPLLAPAAAGASAGAIVVTLKPAAHAPLPAGAIPLGVEPGFVLLHATARDAQAWRSDPRVLRVDPAEPLAYADAPMSGGPPDDALRLTRATPDALAPFGADGRGVTVAVVDSGVDATHPDLAGRVVGDWRLVDGQFVPAAGDPNGHGTHVAGIVAADGASSQGAHVGTAPGASIVALDILSESFTTTSALLAYDWLDAHHAEYGIRVVVNAWGRVGDPRTFDPDDPLVRAIDRVVDDGVVVIFSATNHGPAAGSLSVEAQDPRVVTVGAVDDAAIVTPYSSRGPVAATVAVTWTKPDVMAPGESIVGLRSQETAPNPSIDPDPLHRVLSGTSQAAPHVAGVVARMLDAQPDLKPLDVLRALRASAVDLGPTGPDDGYGYGLLDAPDALRAAMGEPLRRDNPLAAGGDARYDDAAQVAATPTGFLGLTPEQSDVWKTTFPVQPGATAIGFELDAPSLAQGLEARLEGPRGGGGAWTGPTQESGQSVLRGRLDGPEPGTWTLHVRAALPASAQLASHVDVQLGRNLTRLAPLDPRARAPDAPEQGSSRALSDVLVLAGDHAWAAPLAAAFVVAPFGWLAWRARRA